MGPWGRTMKHFPVLSFEIGPLLSKSYCSPLLESVAQPAAMVTPPQVLIPTGGRWASPKNNQQCFPKGGNDPKKIPRDAIISIAGFLSLISFSPQRCCKHACLLLDRRRSNYPGKNYVGATRSNREQSPLRSKGAKASFDGVYPRFHEVCHDRQLIAGILSMPR